MSKAAAGSVTLITKVANTAEQFGAT